MSDALITLKQLGRTAEYTKAYHDSTIEDRFMPIDGGTFTGGYFGTTVTVGDDGSVDLSLGSVFILNPTSSVAVSLVNVPENACSCFSLIVKIDEKSDDSEPDDEGSGESSGDDEEVDEDEDVNIVWPDNIEWNGKSVPSFDVGKTYVLSFLSSDGGNSWFGCVSITEDPTSATVEALTDEEIDSAWAEA